MKIRGDWTDFCRSRSFFNQNSGGLLCSPVKGLGAFWGREENFGMEDSISRSVPRSLRVVKWSVRMWH